MQAMEKNSNNNTFTLFPSANSDDEAFSELLNNYYNKKSPSTSDSNKSQKHLIKQQFKEDSDSVKIPDEKTLLAIRARIRDKEVKQHQNNFYGIKQK